MAGVSATAGILVGISAVGLLVVWLAVGHNRFVRLRNLVAESWRQVDVELGRRHDLVPDLVEVVRGHATHERAVLDRIVAARASAAAPSATVDQQAGDEVALTDGLRALFAVGEGYPALRANRQFVALQRQLAETEDRIAAARRSYNGNVRALNSRVETFPSSVAASLFRVAPAEYFLVDEVQARAAPHVARHA
jgi:LemA protein